MRTQGQQKSRNPSIYTRPPSPAHHRRMATSSRGRPEASPTSPANRHGPSIRKPVSENTTNSRGNALGVDFRRPITIAIPPAHDQSLRRASSTRAGLWEFSARCCRDEPDVAGESRLWALYENHCRSSVPGSHANLISVFYRIPNGESAADAYDRISGMLAPISVDSSYLTQS